MSKELVRMEDINDWEQRQKVLKDICSRAENVVTPASAMEQGDGQPFASVKFEYLHQQANEFHPRRTIEIITDRYNEKFIGYEIAVQVTDLETGESRAGCAFHPVIAFQAATEQQKSIKAIRQKMNNARKAALSLAIRDAYAHFGIAADKYGMIADEPMTDEQVDDLNQVCNSMKDIIDKSASKGLMPNDKWESWDKYIKNNYSKCLECTSVTAIPFIAKLKETLTKLKEQYNDNQG